MKKFLIMIICVFPIAVNASGTCLIYHETMDISHISNRPYILKGEEVWKRLDREVKTDRSSFYRLIPWFIFTLLIFVLVLVLFIVYIKNNR